MDEQFILRVPPSVAERIDRLLSENSSSEDKLDLSFSGNFFFFFWSSKYCCAGAYSFKVMGKNTLNYHIFVSFIPELSGVHCSFLLLEI